MHMFLMRMSRSPMSVVLSHFPFGDIPHLATMNDMGTEASLANRHETNT
jgi:hypothetical protein